MVESLALQQFYLELFSTIFFAGTIGIMIWEAYRQKKDFKAQIEGLRKESYEIIRNDHNELCKLLIENKTLLKIWELEKPDKDTKNEDREKPAELEEDEEKQIFQFYILQLDLYERLFFLMIKEESNVPYHEWQMWLSWLENTARHPHFKKTFDKFAHIYDPELVKEINENIFELPKCKICGKSFQNMKEIVEHINESDDCYLGQESLFQRRAKEIKKDREVS